MKSGTFTLHALPEDTMDAAAPAPRPGRFDMILGSVLMAVGLGVLVLLAQILIRHP